MRRTMLGAGLVGLAAAVAAVPPPADAACCYFSAKDKDVLQPGQKAFLTWDPVEKVETFTVQPRFEGNAQDFGMVIPTPGKPKLDEMPRDFFKTLAVFTILEPMDLDKYKNFRNQFALGAAVDPRAGGAPVPKKAPSTVKVLEAGVVGSLDYKVITAERADDLYTWLKDNGYKYAGDEATLGFYVGKKWFFTVMKIDTQQMKRNQDGSYLGEVTPTRFTFPSEKLVYPLRITQISVKDKTEALFYVQAPHKLDLVGDLSYQWTFAPMWSQAAGFAVPEKLTEAEKAWRKVTDPKAQEFARKVQQLRQKGVEPATLEWARKITDHDLGVLDGTTKYNREAPKEDVDKLKILKGHVKKGQFVTKFRKVFTKAEMGDDLEFVRARIGDADDDMEYVSILPTSPP
ncbi:MAG: hypothetical protein C0501_07090 [Isosphaera sp.]|nr:hypothetical protein [Isosphaera sp.]